MNTKIETPETKYSDSGRIILQILPNSDEGKIEVNGIRVNKPSAWMLIPQLNPKYTIACPFNYFQENVSLSEKWIVDNGGNKQNLHGVDNLHQVTITIKTGKDERAVDLSIECKSRLLKYFYLDIFYNMGKYRDFDCYAFVSLLSDVNFNPKNPEFDYIYNDPSVGDIVVLAESDNLPESINHWALYLGDDRYISKTGRSGQGTQSLVEIINLQGMLDLYRSNKLFIAKPQNNAKQWSGYPINKNEE